MAVAKKDDHSVKPLSAKETKAVVLDDNFKKLNKLVASGNVFGHDGFGLRAVNAAMQILSTTTGMYARIPIYCKDEDCPFAGNCTLQLNGVAPKGQACPLEVAMIDQKLRAYSAQFGLDAENPEQATDWALVEEIIVMDVYLSRCKARMALEQDPVQMMVVGTSEGGDPIMSPNVSKYVEAYERFSKKRDRDYELLLATRKSVQKDRKEKGNADIFELIEKAQSMPGFWDAETETIKNS